ncbi:MAG: hydrogenase maturation protease [Acidimicrobiales bacterium]
MRVLIAGVGNVLRGDDAFGVEVARRLAAEPLPPDTRVVETGIGGVALVHELQDGWDALIVADAVARDRPPGTVMLIELDVFDIDQLTWRERSDFLADMHLATPERALMLAQALGVLPARRFMVGCQPVDADAFGPGMSEPVQAAVDIGIDMIRQLLDQLRASPTSSTGATGATSSTEAAPADAVPAVEAVEH